MTKTNLFKAKKQEQELHILGTGHNISINVLPEFVKEFVTFMINIEEFDLYLKRVNM